ncbi:MAG: class I SAM-dependent methyltransferase [Pseudomonadota bacterium]
MSLSKVHRTETGRSYKGIPIHAANGLHEYVAELLSKQAGSIVKVLELGAGSGALTNRLTDEGFSIDPVDLDGDSWKFDAISPQCLDLNMKNWEGVDNQYDAIVAVEIIEHLENPRHFIEQIYKHVKPNGVVIITTPNIMSSFSKLLMLKRNAFYGFDKHQYYRSGHMTILPHWLLEVMVADAGFVVTQMSFVGSLDEHVKLLQKVIYKLFGFIDRLLNNKLENIKNDGLISVLLLKK